MIKSLFKDTFVYGLSAILSRGLALLVLPIYTRVLSPADYGALDMIMVASSLATLVIALEVAQAVARFYAEAESGQARRMMASTAFWFTLGAYGAALALALLASQPLSRLLLGAGMETPFRIGAAYIAATGVFYLMQNQLRFELRSSAYAVISLVYAVTTIGFGVLLGYQFDLGLQGILAAQLIAAILSIGTGLYLLRDSYGLAFNASLLKEMLAFSLPLVPSGLATFLTLYANRLLLNAIIGLEAVGLFGVATRIASAVALLIVGLQSALTPLIYAHYKEPETPAHLARIVEGFVFVAFGCCLVLGLFAWEILTVFAEPRYLPAAALIMALAPATLLGQMYIFFPGIAIARKTHHQLVIFVITAIGSLGANWLLIGAFGLAGAVVATLLSAMLFIGLWIWASQRLYPLPVRWMRMALICLLFAGAGASGLAIYEAGLPPLVSSLSRLALLAVFTMAGLAAGLIPLGRLRDLANRARHRMRSARSAN